MTRPKLEARSPEVEAGERQPATTPAGAPPRENGPDSPGVNPAPPSGAPVAPPGPGNGPAPPGGPSAPKTGTTLLAVTPGGKVYHADMESKEAVVEVVAAAVAPLREGQKQIRRDMAEVKTAGEERGKRLEGLVKEAKAEGKEQVAEVKSEMKELRSELRRFIYTVFLPLILAMMGLFVTFVLRSSPPPPAPQAPAPVPQQSAPVAPPPTAPAAVEPG